MKRCADRFSPAGFSSRITATADPGLRAASRAHAGLVAQSHVASVLMLLLLGTTSLARATALFVVGAGGTQAGCGYATIQDAVTAEAAYHGSNDYIYIARSQSYSGQAIVINNQNVQIIGGVDDCNHYTPSGTTTVSGSGGAATSVISIRGNSTVTISHLQITGGDDNNDQEGGGIDFAAKGSLTIDNSTISNNHAGYGGGINFNGSGGTAELHINANTLVVGNTAAVSGGGIRVEGNAQLFMLQDFTTVFNNEAQAGFGGGVEIIGPASAYIGSPGYGGLGVIYSNKALHGGGISVNAGNTGSLVDASLDLFSTDPTRPVRISNNVASATGGGIYVNPYVSSAIYNDRSFASVCASDFRIDNNIAKEGTAIYSDEENSFGNAVGGQVYLDGSNCGSVSTSSLGAVACSLGADCRLIDGNVAFDINNNNQPTTGATILAQDSSDLGIKRVAFRDNVGGYVLRYIGNRSVSLTNALITDNQVTQDLIWQQYDSLGVNVPLTIESSTLAHNQIGGFVIRDGIGLSMFRSIIDEPGASSLSYTGNAANLNVSYVLAEDATGFPNDPTNRVGEPTFVDAAHGDYRLRYSHQGGVVTASAGLDFAPAVTGNDLDIRRLGYDQDQSGLPDLYGVRDIGAFEMQPYADRVFTDTFGDPVLLAY